MSNVEKEPGPKGDSSPPSTENIQQEKKAPREYKDIDDEHQHATSAYRFCES